MTMLLPFEPGAAMRNWDDLFAQLEADDGLRWYQREAITAINAELENNRSTLIVMATGLGKTRVFSQLIREWNRGPVLVLAHREELIQQAKESLERIVGEYIDIERAGDQASHRARFVVGSVQSMSQKKRLERLGPDRFSLVVIDEGHHAPAASYKRVCDWFGGAKILGVTATPDRGDEKALGQVFESVAYVFDIEQGIEDGFLVPIRGRHVDVKEADISTVKTQNGDLAEGALDEAMLKAVSGIVHETMRLEPDRKGIAFWPGVRSSKLAAETFNRLRPGSAVHVDAHTPRDERAQINSDFRRGVYQYYCNVGIATEGFDCPDVNLVIHGRPTKSRALFAQMSGRGTRVLPGVIDSHRGKADSRLRVELIRASNKPDLMMLDFVSNSGKHDLVTPEDLLGGSYSEEEVSLAKKKRGGGGDVRSELEKARAELKKLADEASRRRVESTTRDFDPFRAFGMNISDSRRYSRFGKPPPEWLLEHLVKKRGVPQEEVDKLSNKAAFMLRQELNQRQAAGLCTFKQAQWLQRYGVDPKGVSFERAKEALDYIFACRKKGDTVSGAHLDHVVSRQRQPGEE